MQYLPTGLSSSLEESWPEKGSSSARQQLASYRGQVRPQGCFHVSDIVRPAVYGSGVCVSEGVLVTYRSTGCLDGEDR